MARVLGRDLNKCSADVHAGNSIVAQLSQFDREESRTRCDLQHLGAASYTSREPPGFAAKILHVFAPGACVPFRDRTLHAHSLPRLLLCGCLHAIAPFTLLEYYLNNASSYRCRDFILQMQVYDVKG